MVLNTQLTFGTNVCNVYSHRPGCNGTVEVMEATRTVDRICSRSVDNSQPRFQYNLTANPVRLKYFTLRGQMQSTPDIGFWLSYRHIQCEYSDLDISCHRHFNLAIARLVFVSLWSLEVNLLLSVQRKPSESEQSVMYQDDSTKDKDKITVSAKVSNSASPRPQRHFLFIVIFVQLLCFCLANAR